MNIWPWSRIRELERANANLNRRLEGWEDTLGRQLAATGKISARILASVSSLTPGIGRIIAKLEPKFSESEFTPERKAESDRLAEETIRRLAGEAAAREPYNNV